MGHLINPTGFRLGVLHNWKDNWMSSNYVAYSELLHNVNSLKEAVRDHLRVSSRITPIIYSHFNLEQLSSEKLSLRVYYYDSDIEFKYRDLRYACKRIYLNHRRLYRSFFQMHRYFLPELRLLSKQEKAQFFYASLVRRGFFEYLLLRKLVFLFLCAMARDETFKTKSALLLQIKLGIFSLLEYNWRKNLFYGKQLNFFEFFIGIFIQMQFLEQNVVNNVVRASLLYYQTKKRFNPNERSAHSSFPLGKFIELSFLSKWFKYSRMSFLQKLLHSQTKLDAYLKNKKVGNTLETTIDSKTDNSNIADFNAYKNGLEYFRQIVKKIQDKRKYNRIISKYTQNKTDKSRRLQWALNIQSTSDFSDVNLNSGGSSNSKTSNNKNFERVALGYIARMGSLFYWLSEKELYRLSYSKEYYYTSDFLNVFYSKMKVSIGKKKKIDSFFSYNRKLRDTDTEFVPSFFENKDRMNDISEVVGNVNQWSLFAYSYIKYSYNLWKNSSELLTRFLRGKYLSYYNIYTTLSKHWISMSVWAVNLFLDFYRMFLARTYYIYRFGFNKLNIETKLNKLSLLPVEIEFFGFDNDWVTAPFVAFYLARKFEQDFTIKELFKPICRDLKRIATRTPYLLGYKLQFVGRLTRRDRLRTSWVMGGRVPLSTISANVEYGNDFGILRNGVCSIKVWLYRPRFVGDPSWTYLYKVVF